MNLLEFIMTEITSLMTKPQQIIALHAVRNSENKTMHHFWRKKSYYGYVQIHKPLRTENINFNYR